MRVLHLFGDWKWTGPAEPVLDLCLELRARGVDASLACPPAPPEASTNLPAKARERGLVPRHDLKLNKQLNLRDNLHDLGRLKAICEEERLDVVHVHFSHDHGLAGLAVRRAANRPLIFRTNHKAVPTKGAGSRMLFKYFTDGYLTYSREALAADDAKYRLDGRGRLIPPGMRLERFDPTAVRDQRPRFGARPSDFVLGVVARMQRHRRFDVLLEGVKRARVPGLKVWIVGRGTHMQEVAVEPARRLGLENVVTFTGYLGEDYLSAVGSFDALLFLVPGSDGTCRALREAMAMGRAVIGARRGMIPELVDDGRTGLVIDDTPEGIAAAIEKLAADRDACRRMGEAGRAAARARFDLGAQAAAVMEAYEAARLSRA